MAKQPSIEQDGVITEALSNAKAIQLNPKSKTVNQKLNFSFCI